MTTYIGGDQIDRAQDLLQRHSVSSADGTCITCAVPGPCHQWQQAAAVFRMSLRLPRRVPGSTRPELIGARRIGS